MLPEYLNCISEHAPLLDAAADYIWDHPELAFGEYESAECLIRLLRSFGFDVKEALAGIPTAFSASFGSGKPVIGILGEFDALSGLGQEAGCAEQKPDGKPNGHGCGHNLLGVAGVGAALAVKRFLETSGQAGTITFFGCPGEEGGSGKAFLARDGVFRDLDAAITWHPGDRTAVQANSTLANCQIRYAFDGTAAHAGANPDLGRSALDAVELMNVGVQFLREHMPSSCRVHYAITDPGGVSPNVVQPHAEVLYLMRGTDNAAAKELSRRVDRIAEGAALMTDTRVTRTFIKACSNMLLNRPLQELTQQVLQDLPGPRPTKEHEDFCRALLGDATDAEQPIHWETAPLSAAPTSSGSSDVGDVSWVCPTVWLWTSVLAEGTPGHSWQNVAQGKTEWAHQAMRHAAVLMGETAVRLFRDPEVLREAQEVHRRLVGPEGYVPPIPEGIRPLIRDRAGRVL